MVSWYIWDYQIWHELFRKTNISSTQLLKLLDSEFINKLTKEEYELSKVRPNHVDKIWRIYEEIIAAISNKDIPWYIQKYELSPNGKISIAEVDVDVHSSTMIPRLTTLELINQIFEYIWKKELSNYQIIDIGTGETNFIPKAIKHYKPSVEVLWFDVEMMFDDNWEKSKGKFWSRDTIRSYINKKKSLIITANLPYSPEEDIQSFDLLVQQESKNVWHRSFKGWWKDGLDLYRMYIDDISSDEENLPKIELMVFEALEKNIYTLEQYVKCKFPDSKTSFHKNYKGENRILRIEL